jgi:flagellum-specific peptidoglycan hydrolase FlgJ
MAYKIPDTFPNTGAKHKNDGFWRLLIIVLFSWMLVSWWHRSCVRPKRPEAVEAYVQRFGPTAQKLHEISGVPAGLQIAVAGLETGWGSSDLSQRAHNHFGIKASRRHKRLCLQTSEFYQRRHHRVTGCFRAYAHPDESYLDFSQFLLSNPRYNDLFKIPTDDLEAWAEGLQECGYATDPHYARKIKRVMKKYRLDRL